MDAWKELPGRREGRRNGKISESEIPVGLSMV